MIKTIKTSDARLGMYIHEIKSSWVDHPFWRNSFLLDKVEDLQKLLLSKIDTIIIDTSKGVDALKPLDDSSDIPVLTSKIEVVPVAPLDNPDPPKKRAFEYSAQKSISFLQEKDAAIRIISNSKRAVTTMFKDARMGNAIDTSNADSLVDEIAKSVFRNESALVSLIRIKTKDDFTYLHSVAVCALMIALGKQLKLTDEQIRAAGMAGLLHDLGKAFVDSAILNKPGALTPEEFDHMKLHPKLGYEALIQGGITDEATLDVCLHHHEKMDGTGYPDKLKADDISLFSRMGAICDVYDAVTSNRPYKPGWEPGISLQRMSQWVGHFDPDIFKAFVKSLGIYPVGSVVLLKSGQLAVVIDQSRKSWTTPVVRVFYSTKSKARLKPEDINLDVTHDSIVGHADPALFGIKSVADLWAI